MSGKIANECPVCGCLDFFKLKKDKLVARARYFKFNEGILVRCKWCGVNLKVEQSRLVEFHEEVTESPEYEVYLPRQLINIPETWDLNWPLICTLCLKPVASGDFYKISGTATGLTRVATVEVKVSYCKECRSKIKGWFSSHEEAVSVEPVVGYVGIEGYEFKFRNPQYAKLFRQMNVVAPSEVFKEEPSHFFSIWPRDLARTRRWLDKMAHQQSSRK